MSSPEEPVLTFTLRELLDRVDRGLIAIETKLDHKADKSDVERIERHILDVERAADERGNSLALTIERVQQKGDSADTELGKRIDDLERWRAKVLGLALGVGAASGGIAAAVARALGGG